MGGWGQRGDRRSATRSRALGAVCWLLLAPAAFVMPARATAQTTAGRYFVSFGAEAADGRLVLRTANRQDRPGARESFVFGVRLGAERLFTRELSIELSVAAHQHVVVELRMLEFSAGMRYRVPVGTRSVFYLRPILSLALADLERAQVGLGFGFGIGYRWSQNRFTSRFVEVGYRMRVFPDADPGYAESAFPDYGYRPEDASTLFSSFLGLTFGVDFGPMPRRR